MLDIVIAVLKIALLLAIPVFIAVINANYKGDKNE
jgi:hypothetical protein